MKAKTSGSLGLGIAGLLALVLALSGCAGGAKSESTGEYIDDTVVTAKVKTALTKDLGADALTDITVETFKGKVQLSGFVDSASTRSRAGAVTAGVNGVTAVDNRLAVK